MSIIKSIRQQLGLSVTPANNFTLDASANNGTMKLARGNAGATTQDVMTVAASGKVAFPQMGQSLAANGYVELPGGLIFQWTTLDSANAAVATGNFPILFPNTVWQVTGNSRDYNAGLMVTVTNISNSQFRFSCSNTSNVKVVSSCSIFAIGC